jgi:hypothetical protein
MHSAASCEVSSRSFSPNCYEMPSPNTASIPLKEMNPMTDNPDGVLGLLSLVSRRAPGDFSNMGVVTFPGDGSNCIRLRVTGA